MVESNPRGRGPEAGPRGREAAADDEGSEPKRGQQPSERGRQPAGEPREDHQQGQDGPRRGQAGPARSPGQGPPPERPTTPRREVPPDGGAPSPGVRDIEAFERSMVGGVGSYDDPMLGRGPMTGERPPPRIDEYEREAVGAGRGVSRFEDEFLRYL